MADPGKLEQVTQGLGAVQTLTAVAAALGIGTIIRAGWKRATLSYDERLLIEIAKHKASQDRANEIRGSLENLGEGDATREALKQIANRLDDVANRNLITAIATASWNNSKWRKGGQAALVLGILILYMDYLTLLITTPHHLPSWMGIISICAIFLLWFAALLIFTFLESSWINAEAENKERRFHRNVRTSASALGN